MTHRVVVIGGGIGGCAAALRLSRSGHDVILLERGSNLGGLVVNFEISGTPIECFYHHVFPGERALIRLVNELGLGGRFEWRRSSVGILAHGRIWPFTSAVDLLRFTPLPFVDRLRTGIGSIRLTGWDWGRFDRVQAREWLRVATGDRAMQELWGPLLRFKFGTADTTVPASWMAARFRQRAAARTLRGERLGYMRGGFRQLFDACACALEDLGSSVRTDCSVARIALDEDRVTGVELESGEQIESDAVLYSGQLPGLTRLLPPESCDPRWTSIGRLGAICLVLELRRSVTDVYWTNVCDDEVPFGAFIEHTNLVPVADYAGTHVVYLGRYFTADDPVGTADLDEVAEEWLDALEGHLPGFTRDDVLDVHKFRTPHASPLITLGYRHRIPPVRAHLDGLYVATTAQIYPEDRGMNEGVKLAGQAVEHVLSSLPSGDAGGRFRR